MQPDRGVALYSGRWRGPRAEADLRQLVANHKWALVDRFDLDVVTVGYAANMCGMTRAAFLQSSVQLWDLPRERLRVVHRADPHGRHLPNRSMQVHLGPWVFAPGRVAQPVCARRRGSRRAPGAPPLLRQDAHDALKRRPLDLAQVDRGGVRDAKDQWVVLNHSHVIYHDWIYVANAASTLALSSTSKRWSTTRRVAMAPAQRSRSLQLRKRGGRCQHAAAVNITIIRFSQHVQSIPLTRA